MAQSLACLYYHLIFSTKQRAAMIVPAVQPRLYDYIGGIIRNEGGRLLAAGGIQDHVHLLASFRPTSAVSDVLRDVKANSSKWLHETFPTMQSFGWQDGYAAFTVSHSNIEKVCDYILRQEEHHRRLTFQEEFVQFLERHGVEYDLEYIWR
ncbi:MAG: IS200/IS605 family transposase [Planctomycetes bacterium]|nr:IS200/IS605 family transposase [Planctomycetota bacterium]